MKEYIERDAALKELGLNCKGCPELDCECCWVKASKNHIKEVPAAETTPVVHGAWSLETDEEMPNFMFKLVKCSSCGEKANHTYNYCPNCGAKMDGGNKL